MTPPDSVVLYVVIPGYARSQQQFWHSQGEQQNTSSNKVTAADSNSPWDGSGETINTSRTFHGYLISHAVTHARSHAPDWPQRQG
ncbi:hypothetical protein PoB_002318700 [Plakobranchus ocellatus]|uniref:Uncharacterized protein n=1 Tax=Plakobranchus ocellatus TaxID=259542 RepID=A0AAV3ZQA5_9GAST|nr:hypothetical protein PoB_002318700 [Plakobranchus ocellatus]